MSQHYLKYHFKSFIHNINTKATEGDNNGNVHNVDTETDMMNGNVRQFNCHPLHESTGKIRITENPLPENILNC